MEVHSGYLTVKINSGLLKSKSYANHWCILFSGKGQWLPRVDIYQHKEDVQRPALCKKSIFLEQVKWTAVDSVTPAFALDIKGKNCAFKMNSEKERLEWVEAMCCVSPELREDRGQAHREGDFFIEDNVLYDSSPGLQTFYVVSDDHSSDCLRLNLKGRYKLVIGPTSILITLPHADAKVVEWPLTYLRKYGHSKNSFFVQVGSKCESGEGEFSFVTTEGEKIVASVSRLANQLNEVKDSATHSGWESSPPPYASVVVQPGPESGHIRTLSSGSNKPIPPVKPKYSGNSSPPPISPKPILFPPHPTQGEVTKVLSNLKSELNKTISQTSEFIRRGSNGSISSDSSSKTDSISGDRKAQRKMEKEEKKRKKEEKKKQKEAEKLKKKEEKALKEKAKAERGKPQPLTLSSNVYSSTDDYATPYNDVNNGSAIPVHYAVNQLDTGPVYNDPWENRPLPSPTMAIVDDPAEDIYAQASKPLVNGGRVKPDQEYEDVSEPDYTIPPALPHRLLDDLEECGVYEHLHQAQVVAAPIHENIYGMASAKALVKKPDTFYEEARSPVGYRPVLQQSEEDTTYETVN